MDIPDFRQNTATRLGQTRRISLDIAEPLSAEEQVVQPSEDASPTKWHLAHTTWFFEEVVLKPFDPGYREYDPRFNYCFNSYYEALGPRHPRLQRGLLTRPTHAEVLGYRAHVDEALRRVTGDGAAALPQAAWDLLELGVNHEQQHQELMMTDCLVLFAGNPLQPAYRPAASEEPREPLDVKWIAFDGGISEVGHEGGGFSFDNETPRHECLLRPFRLANRAVTNGEWLEFMNDGGYDTVALWLSDGWSTIQREGWRAPLYWERGDDGWSQMTLRGLLPIDPSRPVSHISFYEADAFSRWAGKRLPTEFEWEVASEGVAMDGNFLGHGALQPCAVANSEGLSQMFGDVWEWTASPYVGYPGFKPAAGAVGEYNGKFMCNQFVLKGGSCITPDGHVRRTYRNFFYPHQRWQFTGLRLASDA